MGIGGFVVANDGELAMQHPRASDPVRRMVLSTGLIVGALTAQAVTYRVVAVQPLSRFTSQQFVLLLKRNHVDSVHLGRLSRMVVPDRWDLDELLYSPMPQVIPQLSQERKAIAVDLPGQTFGAYESGKLVRWGPVCSGGKGHQTPPGVYHLNWRARIHVSRENPTWIMPWCFNFAADRGLALHQYVLPGRPASHGCVRMLDEDAKWLFYWGEGWIISASTGEIAQSGTLVLILGRYDFRAVQPWMQPTWWHGGISSSLPQIAPGH